MHVYLCTGDSKVALAPQEIKRFIAYASISNLQLRRASRGSASFYSTCQNLYGVEEYVKSSHEGFWGKRTDRSVYPY